MTASGGARSGAEIQEALRAFATRWRDYGGKEIAEAQTFLNELVSCYGLDRKAAGILYEHHFPGVGRADMFWPGRAIVEMKAPDKSPNLADYQPQADRYYRASADPNGAYPAVRYVVLSSFHRLMVWDMHQDPSRPAVNRQIVQGERSYDPFAYLEADAGAS